MRIISQNLVSFPFERTIVEVDDNFIMCRLCVVPEKRYCLGTYKDCERAKEVFKELDKHYSNLPYMEDGATLYNLNSFVMPEE